METDNNAHSPLISTEITLMSTEEFVLEFMNAGNPEYVLSVKNIHIMGAIQYLSELTV